MIVVKYALAALVVVAGLVAYSRRDAVTDAYDWDPRIEKTTYPMFDPKTVAEQHRLDLPGGDIVVAVAPDTRRAVLPTVAVPPTSAPVDLKGGKTTIGGVVLGPGEAPLEGAVVRIERFDGDRSTSVDLTTNASGAFAISEMLGGRYRLRAWLAPSHAQMGSEVTFIGDGEQRAFRLELDAPNATQLLGSASASQIILGTTGSVSATMRIENVTSEGRVGFRNWPGQIVNVAGGGIFTGFGASLTTDGDGTVTVPVACTALGAGSFAFSAAAVPGVSGTSPTATVSVTCAPVPTTTTTTTTTTTAPTPPGGAPPANPAPVAPTPVTPPPAPGT